MRQAFVHEAELVLAPGGDIRAPGGAVTIALCGHWDHEPPCPVAPHHTAADRVGDTVRLRTVFAARPDSEAEVRQRIDDALTRGELLGPEGTVTHWELRGSQRCEVSVEETDLAARLART